MLKFTHSGCSILYPNFFYIFYDQIITFIGSLVPKGKFACRFKEKTTTDYFGLYEYVITNMRNSKPECTSNESVFCNTFFNLGNFSKGFYLILLNINVNNRARFKNKKYI